LGEAKFLIAPNTKVVSEHSKVGIKQSVANYIITSINYKIHTNRIFENLCYEYVFYILNYFEKIVQNIRVKDNGIRNWSLFG